MLQLQIDSLSEVGRSFTNFFAMLGSACLNMKLKVAPYTKARCRLHKIHPLSKSPCNACKHCNYRWYSKLTSERPLTTRDGPINREYLRYQSCAILLAAPLIFTQRQNSLSGPNAVLVFGARLSRNSAFEFFLLCRNRSRVRKYKISFEK